MNSTQFFWRVNRLRRGGGSRGFTLIELLIVIAIILILIAIALPNFLEAQIRARVTKSKGEIRSLVIAMESYFLDWNVYPAESEHDIFYNPNRSRSERGLFWLTTPVAYITAIPQDPFPGQDASEIISYEMGGVTSLKTMDHILSQANATWAIFSRGPDAPAESIPSAHPNYTTNPGQVVNTYSPTNGTKSSGDLFHYGGEAFFIGVAIDSADIAEAKNRAKPGLNVDGTVYLHRLPPGIY